jgi:hypothetical protein
LDINHYQGARKDMNIANFEKESELWQKSNPVRIKQRECWLDKEITKIMR